MTPRISTTTATSPTTFLLSSPTHPSPSTSNNHDNSDIIYENNNENDRNNNINSTNTHNIPKYSFTRLVFNTPLLFALLFMLHLVTVVHSAPIQSATTISLPTEETDERTKTTTLSEEEETKKIKSDFDFIRNQLETYGYLRGNPSLHEFTEALKFFQEVLGVEVTGKVDEDTLAAASKPRCSQADVRHPSKRSRRYSLSKQAKWDRKHFTGPHALTLKWFISDYTKDIKESDVRSIVKKAFDLWTTQSNINKERKVTLTFVEASSKEDADINILWAEGAHGDNYNFDGANGKIDSQNRKENVLAHTFFPGYDYPLNGDIHFDDAEKWDTDISAADNGKRFFPYVLAHEIGHTLGLSHSRKLDALMYPYYKNVPLEDITLDVDDKCGINWNYGGSSNFCLFVWLMSEIVEFHNMSTMGHGNAGVGPITTYRAAKKRLIKNTRIPKCSSQNSDFKLHTEEKLVKNLQFTEEQAQRYSQVVCNFLAGLHMYRGSRNYSPEESIEKEFRGVHQEVVTFTGGVDSSITVKRMLRHADNHKRKNLPNVFEESYFNAEFFDEFFKEYEH